jgi:hypothetical protein
VLTTGRVALLVAVAALAFAGWRFAAPASNARDAVADQATELLARPDAARLTVAAANLEVQRRTTGSYAGAVVPSDTALVRADATTYCVQLAGPGAVMHLAGPGGTPASGAC